MRISRRYFIGAGVAAAAVRPSRAQSFDADVVIIGAGAAGYGAARELSRAGFRFVLIEARDRVGGRVFTDRLNSEPFDAGAQFIHWSATNPWREIAREVGVAAEPENMASAFVVSREGKALPDADRLMRRAAFSAFWGRLRMAETAREDRSFAQLVEGQPELRGAAEGTSLLSLGDDPEHISLADYAQLWGGDDLVVRDGYGTLVARALSAFPARLSTPARAVRWSGPGVAVETPAGDIRAAAALITVSVGVLQSGAIRFDPALPAETTDALAGLRMGALTKVALAFDGDRLGLATPTDLFDIGARPGQLLSVGAWENGRNVMVAMLGGQYARDLIAQGEAAAVDHVLARVVAIVGTSARAHFRAGRLEGWAADPYALGSYALARPGRLAAREALARPLGERVWLAGEATAGGGAMSAGGAMLAGERAAREIATILRKKG